MKKKLKTFLLNILIFSVAFMCAGAFAEFVYSKFLAHVDSEGDVRWECKNFSKTLLGGFKPNCKGRWIKINGSQSFNVEFSTDKFGRRTVFEKARKLPSDTGQALFFGGSDVLGKGLDDRDTVANQFLNLSDFVHVKNYGGPGFGPQHALELLQFSDLTKEAPPDPDRNVMLFFYADGHVERAAGAWSYATTWGAKFPYYVLDPEDQLIFKGNFSSGGRFSSLQLLAKKSRLLDDLFSRASSYISYSDANIRLTAKIFAAMKSELSAKYPNTQFYVVFNPITSKTSYKLKKLLNDFGVDFLDYSKVWDPNNPASVIPEGHPSSLVYRLVAEQLAKDLRK